MRVLLIGGTRFIGAAVARQLVTVGHEVTLFHRGQTETSLPSEVRHLHGDRTRLAESRADILRQRPEVVIDFVARTEAEALSSVETFAGEVSRLVVISSIDVYRAYERLCGLAPGDPDPAPLREEAPLRDTRYPRRSQASGVEDWRHHYDKILVERACRVRDDPPVTLLRLPFVYGPNDYRHRLAPLLNAIDNGEPIRFSPSQAAWRSTRGYVGNVAAAIIRAALDPRATGRLYNVGEVTAASEEEWAREIGELAGRPATILVSASDTPNRKPDGTDWRHHLVVDASRLRQELGYTDPIDLTTGLRETIAWERSLSRES